MAGHIDHVDHLGHDESTAEARRPPELVGREREQRLLDSMVGAIGSGAAALVICGEPGIGKSALLDHAAATASAAGRTVLRTRGVESEVVLPHATVADLLLPLRPLFGHLPRVQREAIEVCLGLSSRAVSNQYLSCVATLNLLSAAGDRCPVVVLVDDLQFVDPPSRRILLFVARHMSAERLLMIFAERDGRDTLDSRPAALRLDLAGLSEPESAVLLGRRGFDTSGSLVDRLHPLCGGNPLALIELASTASPSLLGGTPSSELPDPGRYLQETWSRRLVCLPDGTRAALTVLAVSRSDATCDIAAALASRGLTLAALDPAEAARLIRTSRRTIEFRHPVLRAVIVRTASLAQRLVAYRALARSSTGALHAWYLAAAATGPDDEAVRALTAAAADARRQGAFDGSAAAWRRAADLTDDPAVRATLLRDAAADAFLGGATGDAVAWSEEALRQTSEPLERAAAQLLRSHVFTWIGQPSTAHELLAAGAAALRQRHPDWAGALFAAAIRPAAMDAKVATALAYAQEALRLSGGRPSVETSVGLAQARILHGDVRGALGVMPGVSSSLAALDPIRDQHMLALLAQCWSWADQPAEARRLVTTVIEAAQETGALAGLPYALSVRGEIDTWAGRWAAAYADLTEALRWAVEMGQTSAIGGVLAFVARLDSMRGNRSRCVAQIKRARQEVGPYGIGCLEFYFNSALGTVALAHGEFENAVEHLERTFHLGRDAQMRNPVVFPFAADLVEGYVRLGRRAEATETVAWLHERATATQLAWPLAAAERGDMLLSTTVEAAEEHFCAAEAAHLRREMPYELARTRLAYGEVLRRFRRPGSARSPLEAAFAVFETLGARPWARRAAAELAAAGHPAEGRPAAGTLDRLSPQELQVARAIARGMNNNEAASALFVSRKTVEAHLTRAYRKLGVRSRTDLTRVLTAEGLRD